MDNMKVINEEVSKVLATLSKNIFLVENKMKSIRKDELISDDEKNTKIHYLYENIRIISDQIISLHNQVKETTFNMNKALNFDLEKKND